MDTEICTPNVWSYDAFRKPAQTDLFAWPIPKPAPNFAIFSQRFSLRHPAYHFLISLETYSAKPSELPGAAKAGTDRGWGKPTQAVEANVSLLDQMTDR